MFFCFLMSELLLKSFCHDIAIIGADLLVVSDLNTYVKSINTGNQVIPFENLEALISDSPPSLSLILDDTRNDLGHALITEYALTLEIPVVILSPGLNSDTIFYIEKPLECATNNIIAVLNFFQTTKEGLIWTYTERNFDLHVTFNEVRSNTKNSNVYGATLPEEFSGLLVRYFKAAGTQSYVFFGDKSQCSLYDIGMKNSYLQVTGNFGLFLDECIYQVSQNGSMVLTSELTTEATSYPNYVLLSLLPYLKVFENELLTNFQIFKLYQSITQTCTHSLVNIQESNKVIVGTVTDGVVNIVKSIQYYGGRYNRTIYDRPRIQISANTGTTNPPGYYDVYQSHRYHRGTYFAVDKINREHLLISNFDLILFDQVNCGVSVFNYEFSKKCFLDIKGELGIAYIPPLYSINLYHMDLLKELDMSVPFVSGVGSSGQLSSKAKYPNYTRVVSPSSQFANSWAKLISIFGWKKIVIFYIADGYGDFIYSILLSNKETYGYEFMNAEEDRLVQIALTAEGVIPSLAKLQRGLDIGCNIIFLLMGDTNTFFYLEGFYDLGVRRGDYTFILFTISGADALLTGNLTKREELLHGTFAIYNAAWVGDFGQQLKDEFLKYYDNDWMRSFYIDATTTAVHTIEFLLNQGKNYENITEFMIAQRNTRMRGATGIISIDSSSNDRNLYYFNLFNIYQDSSTLLWHGEGIGLIAPVDVIYYTVLKEPVWSSGSMPLDMKSNYLNCPFREDQIADSTMGENIKIGVSIALLVAVVALTIYSLKLMRRASLPMLSVKCIANFQDYLTLGFIFIESGQVISIGPTFASFNTFLSNISEMISLNLSKSVSFKDGTFWAIFYFVLIGTYLWLFMLIISAMRLHRFLGSFAYRIDDLKPKTIPIMSNYLYLPVVVTMLSILACDKATGSSLSSSYLNYDCNQYCWTQNHIGKVIPAAILLIIYVPLAIMYRTLWQEENSELNIRANSLYLIVKNLSYIALVVLNKTIKDKYPLPHGIIFGVIIIGVLLFVMVKSPFNFDRANLWARVFTVCVLWNTLICTISIAASSQNFVWLILQMVGWLTIIIISIIFQSRLPPSFVITLKGRNINELFRFAFGLAEYAKSSYRKADYENVEDEVSLDGNS